MMFGGHWRDRLEKVVQKIEDQRIPKKKLVKEKFDKERIVININSTTKKRSFEEMNDDEEISFDEIVNDLTTLVKDTK